MTSSKRFSVHRLLLALTLSVGSAWGQAQAPARSEMDSSLMYQLLVAEMSAYGGDAGSAFTLLLDAAQKARSDQLFERTVELALRARAGDSALQAAQAWSRSKPASRDANRYLLQILIGLNKLPETVEPIQRELARLAPKERIEAINLIPRYFVRVSDKELASKVVAQALEPQLSNGTTGAAAYAVLGTMRLLAGDGSGALDAAKRGMALSQRAEEPVQLALSLMDPKLPLAEALVLRHLKGNARTEMHMAYARKLLDLQRLGEALEQARKINTASPDFADAWMLRGTLELQQKRTLDAQAALQTYVGLRQTAARSAETAGSADKNTSSDKGLTQAYFLLAEIAEKNQQPQEARRYLDLIDSPQDALRVEARRALLLAREGKLDEARAVIRAAPELQAEDARAKLNAEVQLLRDYKQHPQAYELLQQAVQREPADADLRYDLAMAAEKLNRIDEMEALLRQVIAQRPDYRHAYNALGYSLADRGLRLPEARQLIQKALEFSPNDPFIQDSLGWVEFRSGNLELALQILQAAYKERPDAEIAAHLGEVLWALRQPEQARTIWLDALAQTPDNDTLLETLRRLSPP